MTENFDLALYLLFSGMVTVFLILLLVVLFSNLLIKLVNKYGPAQITKQEKQPKIHSKEVAILSAVVSHITSGRGEITEIKKA